MDTKQWDDVDAHILKKDGGAILEAVALITAGIFLGYKAYKAMQSGNDPEDVLHPDRRSSE